MLLPADESEAIFDCRTCQLSLVRTTTDDRLPSLQPNKMTFDNRTVLQQKGSLGCPELA